jgi:hypothetical protein
MIYMKIITFITVLMLACLGDNFSPIPPKVLSTHECRWSLCPYKGVANQPEAWKDAVETYTHYGEGTDAYYIDMLHLEYPTEDWISLCQ